MTTLFSFPQLLQQAPLGGGTQAFSTIIMFGLIFLIFYFLIIRPQNKRQKETKSMLEKIKKGDKVQTIGGIRGSVVSVKEDSVIVKVDDNCNLEFLRSAIATIVNPTEKSTEKSGKSTGKSQEKSAEKPATKSPRKSSGKTKDT